MLTKSCERCGKVFAKDTAKYSHRQWAERRFCGNKCAQNKGINGTTTRYRMTQTPDDRRMALHRYVMEQMIGRPVGRKEHVHHRNGIKTDNRPENLELMSASRHAKLHSPQRHPLTKNCTVCAAIFMPHPTKRKRAKTCSEKCRWLATSRAQRRPRQPCSSYRSNAHPCQVAARLEP